MNLNIKILLCRNICGSVMIFINCGNEGENLKKNSCSLCCLLKIKINFSKASKYSNFYTYWPIAAFLSPIQKGYFGKQQDFVFLGLSWQLYVASNDMNFWPLLIYTPVIFDFGFVRLIYNLWNYGPGFQIWDLSFTLLWQIIEGIPFRKDVFVWVGRLYLRL